MISLPWQVRLAATLLTCSLTVYLAKLVLIDNLQGTVEYVFNSLGFLFINVLLVTLVINELLSKRAKNERLEKLNLVIGIFFTEAGNGLISRIISADPEKLQYGDPFILRGKEKPDVRVMKNRISSHRFSIDSDTIDLKDLQIFLEEKRNFLLRLMENPILLEHQSFTALLLSAFHLTAELAHRQDLDALSPSDRLHIAGDISRVYRNITLEWVHYMAYLNKDYPYLYSLAVRTNPYDPGASVEVT